MTKIKAIFFDAGGVLFKLDSSFITDKFIEKFHFSPLLQHFDEITSGENSFKKALFKEGKIKEEDKIEVYNFYKKLYIQSQKIDKDVINIVKKLSKTHPVYCLTNTVDLPLQINRETKLFSIFKKVYGSCEIKVRKPNKKAFLIPLKELNLESKEALLIDDGLENITSAKELGMNVILFKDYKQLLIELKKLKLI